MIFLRYESFREYLRLYPITSALLFINILLFIIMSFSGGTRNTQTLIDYGAMFNHPDYSGQIWRYFSSMFIHIGFDHLLFNSFALFLFSPPLERILGKVKFLVVYIGSGVAGNLASVLLLTSITVSAGASGAIYGVFGAFVFITLYRKRLIDAQSKKTLYIILVIGVIHSLFNPAVNIYAHFGGFIGGILLFSMLHKER
jgi:rhomboid protease GluP